MGCLWSDATHEGAIVKCPLLAGLCFQVFVFEVLELPLGSEGGPCCLCSPVCADETCCMEYSFYPARPRTLRPGAWIKNCCWTKGQDWGCPPYWLPCWKPLLCSLAVWSSFALLDQTAQLLYLPNPLYKSLLRRKWAWAVIWQYCWSLQCTLFGIYNWMHCLSVPRYLVWPWWLHLLGLAPQSSLWTPASSGVTRSG